MANHQTRVGSQVIFDGFAIWQPHYYLCEVIAALHYPGDYENSQTTVYHPIVCFFMHLFLCPAELDSGRVHRLCSQKQSSGKTAGGICQAG